MSEWRWSADADWFRMHTYPSLLGQLLDLGHGEFLLADGKFTPLVAQADDRVARDAGQDETVQRRC